MAFTIRRMTLEDVDAVYEIELDAHIAPWSRKIIHDCVAAGYGCYVFVKRKKVRGFIISRTKTGVCHLLNLCIARSSQGKGIGEAMLVYFAELMKPHCLKMTLEVRPTNEIALKLYKKHGFYQASIKEGYYSDPDGLVQDALVLELDVPNYKRPPKCKLKV